MVWDDYLNNAGRYTSVAVDLQSCYKLKVERSIFNVLQILAAILLPYGFSDGGA